MSAGFKVKLIFLALIMLAATGVFALQQGRLPTVAQLSLLSTKQTFYYKWQDSEGGWHVADQAPDGIQAQKLKLNPNANLLQSVPANTESAPEIAATTQAEGVDASHTIPGLNLLNARQALRDAEQARERLNQRQEQLDSL